MSLKFTNQIIYVDLGGFAHVYLATSEFSIPKGSSTATNKHVLKRIAVQDKKGVEEVGKEVEVMVSLNFNSKFIYSLYLIIEREN